jgi:hypothetical protein
MIKRAAINVQIQIFVWSYVFIFRQRMPMSGMAGSGGRHLLNFVRTVNCFPRWLHYFAFLQCV